MLILAKNHSYEYSATCNYMAFSEIVGSFVQSCSCRHIHVRSKPRFLSFSFPQLSYISDKKTAVLKQHRSQLYYCMWLASVFPPTCSLLRTKVDSWLLDQEAHTTPLFSSLHLREPRTWPPSRGYRDGSKGFAPQLQWRGIPSGRLKRK
jgi:hypothetical protein